MRIYCLVLMVVGSYVHAGINPIQSFTPGSYLGHGSFVRSDGTFGYLSSYSTLNSSGWHLVHDRGNGLSIYQTSLTIDPYGFATAVFEDSTHGNPLYYSGFGNCGSTYCQLTVTLAHGILNKLIRFDFALNQINSYGAIYYQNAPSVQWEEVLYLIPNDAMSDQRAPIFQFPYQTDGL